MKSLQPSKRLNCDILYNWLKLQIYKIKPKKVKRSCFVDVPILKQDKGSRRKFPLWIFWGSTDEVPKALFRPLKGTTGWGEGVISNCFPNILPAIELTTRERGLLKKNKTEILEGVWGVVRRNEFIELAVLFTYLGSSQLIIQWCIKTVSLSWWFSFFSSPFFLIIYWFCNEKTDVEDADV